jgi:hypothetical protein
MHAVTSLDTWRARRERRYRERLADRLVQLVAEAERPARRRPGGIGARVPLDAPEVLRARHELLDLAAVLRSGDLVGRDALRAVHRLVCDGAGPVYAHRRHGDVAAAAERALVALGGRAACARGPSR